MDVNEKGTEAAAATATVGPAMAVRNAVFRADHPLLVPIRDYRPGRLLFAGRVTNPQAS